MIEVSTPGKLVISGEWGMLWGNPGIIAAVDSRVFCKVEALAGKFISFNVEELGVRDIRFSWNGKSLVIFPLHRTEENKVRFIREAVSTVLNFLFQNGISEFRPFKITTRGGGRKIGFGFSSASTVSVVMAVLEFYGYKATKQEIFKLAAISHFKAQGMVGSGFDVAAGTFGGVFLYRPFDGKWLRNRLTENPGLKILVSDEWPGLEVQALADFPGLEILVGWTGQPASTTRMIEAFNQWSGKNEKECREIFRRISVSVDGLEKAWKDRDKKKIFKSLNANREALVELGKKASIPIETENLRKLAEIASSAGGAGKLSGAGGGDCGIAVSFDRNVSEKIRSEWEKAGIQVMDVQVDREGVRKEKS